MLFGLEYESEKDENNKVLELGKTINKGLEKKDFLKNPFRGYALFTKDKILFRITPLYLNPLILGSVLLAIVLFISNFKPNGFLIIPAIVLLGSVLWFDGFYKILIKVIIKKRGYKGSVKWLNADECFDEVVLCGIKNEQQKEE
jgi:hypothetical protein